MQTFLPFPDFTASARVLDRARLGKQRVEVLQVLRALRIPGYGWRTHPAVTMWTGHVPALVAYGEAVNAAWSAQGRPDTTRAQILELAPDAGDQADLARRGLLPPWLGWEALHRSHRSALVRKAPAYCRPHFPDVPDDLPYVWPDPPPAPPEPERPFTAWVVRAPDPALLGSFVASGVVALVPLPGAGAREHLGEDPPPRRRLKRHAVVERFVAGMRPGDLVVTPLGDGQLLVGEITGEYAFVPLPPLRSSHHVRHVRWRAFVPHAALRDPATLQNPQAVFALHGEDALVGAARTGA